MLCALELKTLVKRHQEVGQKKKFESYLVVRSVRCSISKTSWNYGHFPDILLEAAPSLPLVQ